MTWDCDKCGINFESVDKAKSHQRRHCRKGEHCINTDAGCAASHSVDDHINVCCDCEDRCE